MSKKEKVKKEKKVKENKKERFYFLKKKVVAKTTTTFLLIAIIVAAYIGINLLVDKLNILDIDMTKEKLYTISNESKTKLGDIKKEVIIYAVGLNQYEKIFNITDQYNKQNGNIVCEKIEKSTDRPDLVSKYSLTDDTQVLIIESGERSKILSTSELYTYDYETGKEIDLTEEALTNGIIDVTIENKPQICFLKGHNVYETAQYMATLRAYIENEANEIKDIDILTEGSIPETCDVLVITALKEDITVLEKDEIIKYINNGGEIIVLSDAIFAENPFTNFQAVLDMYGASIETNGIVFEQDSDKMIYESPELIKPIVNKESEITKYISTDVGVCFIDATKLTMKSAEELSNLGVEVTELVTSGENAFYRTNFNVKTTDKTDVDVEAGNSILGAMLTKKIDEEKESKLIVYTNNLFVTDLEIPLSSSQSLYGIQFYNNKDLVLNSISYLSQRTDTLTIRKNTSTITFTTTDMQNKVIQIIIYAIPFIIIVVGIVVWQIRRRKK